MLSYNLEFSELPSNLGVKAHSTQSMAASKAFLVLQLCRVVYALHICQVLDKDLGRDLQAWRGGYLIPLAFDAARVTEGERPRLRM